MNNCIMLGRLVKDIEIKTGGNGKSFGKFTLAVNRDFKNQEGKYDADFINCVAFDKRAEVLAQYVTKGQQLAVRGSWRTGNFKKEDGTTAYTNELFVEGFDFIGGQNSNGNNNSNYNTGSSNISNMGFGQEMPVDDGDMPF